ncbi:MAG: fibronectin type III domain-containing protein, partial [Proteobacteria bacterium]|nr:fibronectin type III domain-containing protein [Pseudomonadota bacterium]
MKNYKFWVLTLLVILFFACPAQGGWVELGAGSASGNGISNTSGSSSFPGTNSKALTIGTDGYPITAWSDSTNGNWEIYVRRFDGSAWVEMGTNSASSGGISNNAGASDRASIAIGSDGNPIILWDDNSSGDSEEYVKRWDGSAWVEIGTGSASGGGISNNTGASLRNSIAIGSDGNPIIVWGDNSGGNDEIYLKKWNGSAWVEMPAGSASGGGISGTAGMSRPPFIIKGSDGNPIVAWSDYSIGNWEIYVKRWNGSAWVAMGTGSASGGGISNNTGDSYSPCLGLGSDGNPMVTWHDNFSGNYEVYVKRWNGSAWVAISAGSASGGGISNNAGTSYNPSLAMDLDGNPIITWWDNSAVDNEIYSKRWNGSAWVEISAGSASGGGISNNTAESYHPFVAVGPDGKPIVAWDDSSCSNQEIYVLKYDPDLEPAQNLRAVPGDGKATLSWERSTSPGVVSYWIYSDNGSGTTTCSSPITVVVHPQESVVISNLTNNQAYLFDVRTMNSLNEITWEPNLVSVTPVPDPTGMVRAILKIPQTGKRINGNRTLVMAELEYGTASEVSKTIFQYKPESGSTWTDISPADSQHPNPDLTSPY